MTLRPGSAASVAVVVLKLAPNQHVPLCFSCLCFGAYNFGHSEKCLCVVQRSQSWRVFVPLTQLSSVSDDWFPSGVCFGVRISTAAAKKNIRTTWLAGTNLQQCLH